MIGLAPPADETDPQAAVRVGRLVVAAVSVVTIQAFVLDQSTVGVIRHLDLPLAVAAALVVARPAHSTAVGLVLGLAVDAFGQRLFGLHCLAFAVLGPVARALPAPAGRQRAVAVAGTAGAQALAATVVVIVGQSVAVGGLAPDPLRRLAETALWTAALAVPLVSWIDGDRVGSGGRGGDRRAGFRR